ncbi:MAG: hypothetical protein AB2A00_07940 [Myxococcota bacterium]
MGKAPSRLPLLWLLLVGTACTGSNTLPPVEARAAFSVAANPVNRPFLDIPWPCDLDTLPDGRRDMRSFPNPTGASTLDQYRGEAEKGRGWGLNGTIYLSFTGPLGSLVTPAETLAQDAPVQLVDVDPDSPEKGARIPIRLKLQEQETQFLPPNTLMVLPVLGFPLRPATTYALVVTSAQKAKNGGRLAPSADLEVLLKNETPSDSRLTHAHAAFAPLRENASSVGLALSNIAHATVFTTSDPLPELDRARAAVIAQAPYFVDGWTRPADHDSHRWYRLYEGFIELPQFQKGTPPFTTYDGATGGFELDENGVPRVQRTERVRFSLSVPRDPPPPGGYPLVVIAHGTGGNFRSMVGDGAGDEANWLAIDGFAAIGISQPLHETREGYQSGQEEILTFNFLNPRAGVDNWRQSALESMALMHSISALSVPANVAADGEEITFDVDKHLFFGHSQGGITGALMTGVETDLDVAVLSGTGGGFAESLLEKTEPLVIANAVRLLLSLPDEEPLDEYHPALAVMQMLADPLEPLNAARRYFVPGRKAPNVLIFSGLQDKHTPPRTHGPLAAAAAIPLILPEGAPVEALQLRQLSALPSPVRHNLSLSEGRTATAVLAQFPNDDHFAVYRNPTATALAARFFESFEATGVPEAVR